MERESMEFDVVIVGAGPSGLSAACRLMQQAQEAGSELTVCVVEKGSEVGAHILSGAVIEPTALNELFPNWKELGAPLNTPVSGDEIFVLKNQEKAQKVPNFFAPKTMHNEGNYIVSLGNVCRWLGEQAESLGVEIFPGFSASEVLFNEDGSVKGIATGDMGIGEDGSQKDSYMPGMELHAKYTLFSEGCRGHLGKQLIAHFNLDKDAEPQHYGIGIKELWDIDPDKHQQGLVVHTAGWPLDESGTKGGGFLYHIENNQVALGLITDLCYSNPHLSPFDEMQRYKQNPVIKQYLEGGKRVSYGARAIAKGGPQSLPKMNFPGGLLLGCDAGTLNFAKIKGTHTAMKSGMVAAEEVFKSIQNGSQGGEDLESYQSAFEASWAYKELYQQRNFGPAMHKFGNILGGAFAFIDLNIFNGKLPFTMQDRTPDHATLKPASECPEIHYPKPDGVISFDKLSSVFLSNTNHEEDQPCHLQLADDSIPLGSNLAQFNEPAQRYCPAGVYEIVEDEEGKRFQINSQNCVHCKTCDIKDPEQNITWVTPEGAGGPNYPNM
ncbi:electron transfer flavoprotein-ubiquinone oxidoreductase [Aestuariirhabdus sp. Z084]|uniref:electron transfer flavoprotein-ubiquinone oxidoreductase n=1 Tax=Aestuariirhabdus haliotis TaxID=2918751 RepID=UPI00201B40CA|nr:electron transfer flavoprotein-ubiquinone oxidoreductase [Aestuariirhabdus haliotis]MCL6414831.1 electron transfer flavoprotein-ubiquinone oxidoreductase [Aestuariirhabdus haliotis]MCL6418763.1 electron transfer flavoprotein-ubiquinone oxidoreductase [Aestuariirhabdus haliotis]